ncbi:alanine--tRNA ligase [Candidatus Dojkabacteria bacterium]|uniref:alanine--tRNA ligase n=1 Tax=Candidatus Dojkabacteria bacterium TaxID=2099670 RepID=A0A955L2P8_9BACT|nr:alanine--tRNA ligase [Candidatus Dojkabacteria bacterium]
MTHLEFRKKWREHMISLGHKEVPNIPLPSYSDPTLLFVNSGMFPLVPYLEGEKHPLGKRLFNIQRAIRPMEFDEIGDNRHTSVFEMIGNWSLGDYTKHDQLINLFKFVVEDLKMDPNRIYTTVFAGDKDAPRDNESIKFLQEIFKKYGIEAEVAPDDYDKICHEKEIDLNKYRIFPFRKSENWWQRGDAIGELGGPDFEIFYDVQIEHDHKKWGFPHPATDSGRFIEIGNSVFMEYKKAEAGWELLKQSNVDFGGGLERMVMVTQGKTDIFSTDLYMPAIQRLEKLSGVKYEPDEANVTDEIKAFRVIVDHMKGAVLMIYDGVLPSNKEQGYVLRRAIRRAIRYARILGVEGTFAKEVSEGLIEVYKTVYSDLESKQVEIINVLEEEERGFVKVIDKAIREMEKIDFENDSAKLGKEAFNFLQTYGLPAELFLEEMKSKFNIDEDIFWTAYKETETEHKNLSRKGAEQRFKGGLADTKDVTVRYHTTAHLLLAALQKVLGNEVHQKGQNITDKRLRYDFNFPRGLTDEEIREVEELVNKEIEAGLTVSYSEENKSDIQKLGAEGSFMERYSDRVKIYKMEDPKTGDVFSFEVCGGPHVENTKDILKSGKFKIEKEQSAGAGVRRIRGVLGLNLLSS